VNATSSEHVDIFVDIRARGHILNQALDVPHHIVLTVDIKDVDVDEPFQPTSPKVS
jgi:hypothetical protein